MAQELEDKVVCWNHGVRDLKRGRFGFGSLSIGKLVTVDNSTIYQSFLMYQLYQCLVRMDSVL